jgi:alkaline phosphatase
MQFKFKYILGLFSFLVFFSFISCQTTEENDVPKNIILLIGDGMGYAQVTAASYKYGPLNMTSMPYHGSILTYSADRNVTDSASSATAMAAGYKTNNGMLGVLPDTTAVQSIAQYASELGKRTALLASCRITHATPAAFAVHHHSRGDEFIIAEQFVDSGIDMLLGAGWNYFLPEDEGGTRPDGRNLIAEMEDNGYLYIDNDNDLGLMGESEKVIAFFEGQDLQRYPERGSQMVDLTIAALEQLSQDPNGFFMMIEGAQIDWAGHNNNAEWMLQEMLDFDNVIEVVLDFAERDGNTLVVVTADHETGGLTLLNPEEGSDHPFRYEFSTGGHSGLNVPVYSYGPSAIEFAGQYENTEIARKLFSIWGKEIEN